MGLAQFWSFIRRGLRPPLEVCRNFCSLPGKLFPQVSSDEDYDPLQVCGGPVDGGNDYFDRVLCAALRPQFATLWRPHAGHRPKVLAFCFGAVVAVMFSIENGLSGAHRIRRRD